MRATRLVLLVVGIAVAANGVWLMRDFDFSQLRSMLIFVVGGIVIHDGIVAPLTVAVCFVAARVLPPDLRKPATVALVVWGTVTVVALAVLSGQGGKPDNATILNNPYRTAWLVGTLVVALAVAGAAVVARHRRAQRRQSGTGTLDP